MPKNIEIFYSTVNSKIEKLIDEIQISEINSLFQISIVHQITEEYSLEPLYLSKVKKLNIRIINLKGKGLSRSRNEALINTRTDYIYLTDDDVNIIPESIFRLVKEMSFNNYNFVTGRIAIRGKNKLLKKYPQKNFLYNKFNCRRVSSVEIILDANFINSHRLKYDERFGLGSDYPSCEEYIFLSDMIDSGGIGKSFDDIICFHDEVTSGMNIDNDVYYITRGAMVKRVFGLRGFFYIPILLKKAIKTKRIFRYLGKGYSGFFNLK